MKRILSWGSAFTFVLALGLTGCDGGSGDMAEGVPKNTGYVAPTAPSGSPPVSANMGGTEGPGIKPKKAAVSKDAPPVEEAK